MPRHEHVDGDEALLEAAIAGIARLNRRYGPAPGGDRFLLLHRKRLWNAGEARWIGWERKRGKLHELNRLLRGATDTSFLPIGGQAPRVPADVRYVITLDADTQAAARHGPPPDRQDGAPAQPAALRRRCRPGRGGLCRAAATGHAVVAGRPRGFAVPAHLFQHERHRSLCRGRLRRVPGSVRRRLLCRQGHLRSRRLRGRARRPGARLDTAQPRSVRGHLCPRRSRLRYRGGRGIPRPLRRRRAAPPPLGARRLAVAAVDLDRAVRTQRRPGDRPLEDARQSAANTVGAGMHAVVAGRIGIAVRRRVRVDRLRSRRRSCCQLSSLSSPPSFRAVPGSRRAAIWRLSAAICASRSPNGRSSSRSWRIRHG